MTKLKRIIPIILISYWWLSAVALSEEAEFYVGPQIGILATSPGTYDDNGAIGAIFGYQFSECCWAIEAGANTTLANKGWKGDSLGVFGVFRLGRIGSDFFFFFPKAKIGLIHNRFTIDGMQQESKSNLGWGVGIDFGDKNYVIEIEFSGAASKSLGSDEVAFFSIGTIFPF